MPTSKDSTGPSLDTYIETRLNLLIVLIDKLETSLRERIDAVEKSGTQGRDHLAVEIEHTKQMLQTAQETLKHASERAEKTQHDINIASNEWRATLTDFSNKVPTKTELERFYQEFGAYKLEIEKRTSQNVGERAAKGESKEDWKAILALVIAVAAAVIAYLGK